tara:strand:+ start:392 stop:811 length:420 start_codon:yes stop_codon:yes gene_type:complete
MTKKRYMGQQYEAAMDDGPKYAQYPDEYHPVAYRIMITGIYVTDSAFDPDESHVYMDEILSDMIRMGSADMRAVRLQDAPGPSDEQKAEWTAERVRKAKLSLSITESPVTDGSSFDDVANVVSGAYKAQGILPDEQDQQ